MCGVYEFSSMSIFLSFLVNIGFVELVWGGSWGVYIPFGQREWRTILLGKVTRPFGV